MKKSVKRLLGVVFTLALMTILACGAFAAKPAVELTDVYFTVDAFDGVSPTVCFRNNSNKTIKYVTFTLVPLNAVGDRTSCTISGRSTVTAQVVGPIAPTRFDRTVANTVTSPASMGDFGPFQAQQQLATDYYFGAEERNGHRIFLDKDGNAYYTDSYTPSSVLSVIDHSKTRGQLDSTTYLTDDELQNAIYNAAVEWDCLWYNSTIDEIAVTKADITSLGIPGSAVTYGIATASTAGLVKSSSAQNQVSVNSAGLMTVNSLSTDRLVPGTSVLIFDCGSVV